MIYQLIKHVDVLKIGSQGPGHLIVEGNLINAKSWQQRHWRSISISDCDLSLSISIIILCSHVYISGKGVLDDLEQEGTRTRSNSEHLPLCQTPCWW